jgi:hypothetical protein
METLNIYLHKLYYKYVDTKSINHYRLLLLTENYVNIAKKYQKKYPNSSSWINLNDELFKKNNYAKKEFNDCVIAQKKIKEKFLKNITSICNNDCNNKKYDICSEYFNDFYIDKSYHYEQMPLEVMHIIENDINKNNK